MELGGDTKAVLLAAGLIFLWALLIGVWKYREMAASPEGRAHPYVDVAHRAALLYSFATLLLVYAARRTGPFMASLGVSLVVALAASSFGLAIWRSIDCAAGKVCF